MRENTINRGDVRATQESHKDSDFLYTTDKEVHSLAFIVRYQFLKKSFIIFEEKKFIQCNFFLKEIREITKTRGCQERARDDGWGQLKVGVCCGSVAAFKLPPTLSGQFFSLDTNTRKTNICNVHWLETTTTIFVDVDVDVDGYGSGDNHVDVVVDGDCDDHVDVDVGNAIKWIVVLSSVSGCKLWSLHSVSRPLRDPDLIWIKNRTLSSPTPGGGPEWAGTSHLEMDKVVQSPQTNKLPCYHHSSPAI